MKQNSSTLWCNNNSDIVIFSYIFLIGYVARDAKQSFEIE